MWPGDAFFRVHNHMRVRAGATHSPRHAFAARPNSAPHPAGESPPGKEHACIGAPLRPGAVLLTYDMSSGAGSPGCTTGGGGAGLIQPRDADYS